MSGVCVTFSFSFCQRGTTEEKRSLHLGKVLTRPNSVTGTTSTFSPVFPLVGRKNRAYYTLLEKFVLFPSTRYRRLIVG